MVLFSVCRFLFSGAACAGRRACVSQQWLTESHEQQGEHVWGEPGAAVRIWPGEAISRLDPEHFGRVRQRPGSQGCLEGQKEPESRVKESLEPFDYVYQIRGASWIIHEMCETSDMNSLTNWEEMNCKCKIKITISEYWFMWRKLSGVGTVGNFQLS